MPTAADVIAAWRARKDSQEAMMRLGGILQDLECYVDNCLRLDEGGKVVAELLREDDPVFDHLFTDVEYMISPNTVMLYATEEDASADRDVTTRRDGITRRMLRKRRRRT